MIVYDQRATPALQMLCYYKCMRNERCRDCKQCVPIVVYSWSAYHADREYREIFQQTDNPINRLLRGSIVTKASINRSVGILEALSKPTQHVSTHASANLLQFSATRRALCVLKLVIIVWCHLSRLLSGDVFEHRQLGSSYDIELVRASLPTVNTDYS